jgi:predicted RNase H-like HicB family nuclease
MEGSMSGQAVSLRVVAAVPVDCRFWMEDDGWNGQCERFSIYVGASSFEEAKRKMESALELHISSLLDRSEKDGTATEQAA